ADGLRAQGERSVEVADESAAGSVILCLHSFRVLRPHPVPSTATSGKSMLHSRWRCVGFRYQPPARVRGLSLSERAWHWARYYTRLQGMPFPISDPVTIERVAAIFREARSSRGPQA